VKRDTGGGLLADPLTARARRCAGVTVGGPLSAPAAPVPPWTTPDSVGRAGLEPATSAASVGSDKCCDRRVEGLAQLGIVDVLQGDR
jgi:hypothetical protein